MAEDEHQQDLQKYLVTLNKELEDNQEDEDGNLVLTITTEVDGGDKDEGGCEECNNGTITMDANGNYYFQTSDKTIKVKPITKETLVKTVAASIVTPPKKLNQSVLTMSTPPPSFTDKQTKLEDGFKNKTELTEVDITETKVIKTDVTKNETTLPDSEESISSELNECDETEKYNDNHLNDKGDQDETKGVKKHIKSRSKPTSAYFRCILCPYETNNKGLILTHLKTHYDDRPYKCSTCERGFTKIGILKRHVQKIHSGYKPHACKDCEQRFTFSRDLERHVRYCHTHINTHKCTECDYSNKLMSKVRKHKRRHSDERPYPCTYCKYSSKSPYDLKRHIFTHTGEKPFKCDICHAGFTQATLLKKHRLTHSVCGLCTTTCASKTDLRKHIQKFHCTDHLIPDKSCGKELPDRCSYELHVKTPKGEKCYRCTYCAYVSLTKRDLESHMLKHTDTKPFVCELMSFRLKQLLARHTKVCHTKNYQPPQERKKDQKCPYCDKAFVLTGNLRRHMETHEPSSDISMEKEKLRTGRMIRLQGDEGGLDEGEYEEKEGYEEEYDDFNDGQIQYKYEDFEEEYEGEQQEELLETKPSVDKEMESLSVESSWEQKPIMKTITDEQENDGSELVTLQVGDDPGVMIIEVMQDDEEEVVVDNEQEPKTSQHQVRHNVINNNVTNATVTKNLSVKSAFVNSSDCFGFEVDDGEEEDEEIKGAISLLQFIEQE